MTEYALDYVAMFLALAAAFAWVNARWLGLPNSAALMAMGVATALLLGSLSAINPQLELGMHVERIVESFDFSSTLLDFVLAYILFAGGMQVDVSAFRRKWKGALSLATVGVLISLVVIGFGFWGAARVLGVNMPLAWALVFAALISPTDPVAVLAASRRVSISDDTRTLLECEALFNDGLAIVLFSSAVSVAGGEAFQPLQAGLLVMWEALGGALIGWIGGLLVVRAVDQIDDYVAEVLITVALATGVFAFAKTLQMSGPVAAAIVGMHVGGPRGYRAMSETTQVYVRRFWEAIGELLNSVIFLLIGLEAIILHFNVEFGLLAMSATVIAFLARVFAVTTPGIVLKRLHVPVSFDRMPVLIWGGVRGAVSLALALSITTPYRDPLIVCTYAVVAFSILVQGVTLPWVVKCSGSAN